MKEIKASMAGSMWKMLVKEGDQVKNGQELAIMESMKMEIPVESESDGTIKEIKVAEDDFLNEGDVIFVVE
ncbi:MAG TPA: acetyl-CoA carboxylase biotin carboxyl carrier protein subunit [Pseudogracilibacillus sp.]|nr:acetyl-CoA carboxylase biotin carboxyl carrier protein subunit [Pseudogracilibacillus sp.]